MPSHAYGNFGLGKVGKRPTGKNIAKRHRQEQKERNMSSAKCRQLCASVGICRVSNDVNECLDKLVKEFAYMVYSYAALIAESDNRTTVQVKDVLYALSKIAQESASRSVLLM